MAVDHVALNNLGEKAFALIEVAKIANYRFDDLVADAKPMAAARSSRLSELQ